MKQGRIDLRLGDLENPWRTLCERTGERPAFAALRLIRQELARTENTKSLQADLGFTTCSPTSPDPRKLTRVGQLNARFSESELVAIRHVAAAGCFHSVQAWIIAAVRGALTCAPQFSPAELEALGRSSTQLAALGRNFNQLVRAVNASPQDLCRIGPDELESVRNAIRRELDCIAALVSASTDRWPLVPAMS